MDELTMIRKLRLPRPLRHQRQGGFTIVELMIAMIVLVVGLLAMAGLVASAITTNGRSKVDSTATMLSQAVVEQINSTMIGGGTANLTDCEGTAHLIDTGTAVGDGAKLNSDGSKIDFTEASPPAGYHMDYPVCTTDPDVGKPRKVVYDVRWHVDTIAASGGVTGTYLITVGAVVKGAPAPTANLKAFALPTNLRVLVGPESVK